MTTPCKDCTRRNKRGCPTYRECDKFRKWLNAVWAGIQSTFTVKTDKP